MKTNTIMKLLTRFRYKMYEDEVKTINHRLDVYKHYIENQELPEASNKLEHAFHVLMIKFGDLDKSIEGEIQNLRKNREKMQELESRLA